MTQRKRPTLKQMDKLQALVNDFEAANIRRQGEIDTLRLKETQENVEIKALREQIYSLKKTVAKLEANKSPFAKGTDYKLVDSDLMRNLAEAVLQGEYESQLVLEQECLDQASYWPQAQQEILKDDNNVLRFRKNELVNYLVEESGGHGLMGLNYVATLEASREDRAQLAQLIGYSVDGYQSLGYSLPMQGLND